MKLGRWLLLAIGSLALLSLLPLSGGANDTSALPAGGAFNPRLRFCFDDPATIDPNPTQSGDPGECDGTDAAGVPSAIASGFDIASGDVNFAAIVNYIPSEWGITRGEDIPVGTKVGANESIATIGIINGACDSRLDLVGTAAFTLYNASLDINDTFEFLPDEKGNDQRRDWAEDLDPENGIMDAVDHYPDFISRIVEDEQGNPQQPIRRSAGHIIVAGADVLLQFVIYEPGTFIHKTLPKDPDLGYPAVVFLQNAGDPDIVPEPGPITDFCTPLASTTTTFSTADPCDAAANDDGFKYEDDDKPNDGCPALGTSESEAETEDGSDPCDNGVDDDRQDDIQANTQLGRPADAVLVNDGCPQDGDHSEADSEFQWVLYRNPSEAGTYTFTTIAVGQKDADGDGLENSMDTCPFDASLGDPRIKGDGDNDEDGLDDACDPNNDPTTTGGINSDEDFDGYLNRQDNCPLIPNGEEDLGPDGEPLNQQDNDKDEDGDFDRDQIGDVCDSEGNGPATSDGEPLEERTRVLTQDVEITGEAPPTDETPTAEDGDGDGGLGTGAVIGIIVAIVAGVVVLGGGAAFYMRRTRS